MIEILVTFFFLGKIVFSFFFFLVKVVFLSFFSWSRAFFLYCFPSEVKTGFLTKTGRLEEYWKSDATEKRKNFKEWKNFWVGNICRSILTNRFRSFLTNIILYKILPFVCRVGFPHFSFFRFSRGSGF